jgi:hypothetical protein
MQKVRGHHKPTGGEEGWVNRGGSTVDRKCQQEYYQAATKNCLSARNYSILVNKEIEDFSSYLF